MMVEPPRTLLQSAGLALIGAGYGFMRRFGGLSVRPIPMH